MKGYVSCKPLNSQKGGKVVFFSLIQHYGIIMALRKFVFFIGTVSQVSDVAHGPLNFKDTAVHLLLLCKDEQSQYIIHTQTHNTATVTYINNGSAG